MEKYSLKPNITLFVKKTKKGIKLHFLEENSRFITIFESNLIVLNIIKQLDGIHTVKEVAQKLNLKYNEVVTLVDFLFNNNLLERKRNKRINNRLNEKQISFFSSFSNEGIEYGIISQEKIEKSHVVILGLGTIGTWLVELLCRAGVKNFTLIDPDTVDLSNLRRQSVYNKFDIGKHKTFCIKNKILNFEQEADVSIKDICIQKTSDLNDDVIKNTSLFISCADYPSVDKVNYIVSKYCVKNDIPHILCGGYDGHNSFIGPSILPGYSACWNCYEISKVYDKKIKGLKQVDILKPDFVPGTIAPLASIIASIHAVEAIKILTGCAQPEFLNSKGEFNFFNYSIKKVKFEKQKKCSFCSKKSKNGKKV